MGQSPVINFIQVFREDDPGIMAEVELKEVLDRGDAFSLLQKARTLLKNEKQNEALKNYRSILKKSTRMLNRAMAFTPQEDLGILQEITSRLRQ